MVRGSAAGRYRGGEDGRRAWRKRHCARSFRRGAAGRTGHNQTAAKVRRPAGEGGISWLAKAIMGDEPLFAASIAPQLRARHEKDAPVGPPFPRIFASISLLEQRKDGL